MADDLKQPATVEVTWSQVWQLPVLLLGLGMLALGVYVAVDQPQKADYAGSLDSAAQYLAAKNLDAAAHQLDTMNPAVLHDPQATQDDQARYDQYRGDLAFARLAQQGLLDEHTEATDAMNRQVVQNYHDAQDLGRTLDPPSLGRLAQALVNLDKPDQALAVVDRLPEHPAAARYRLVRKMIEHRQRAGEDAVKLAPLIQRFRKELDQERDDTKALAQRVWITGLQARALLDAGDPTQAIDFLVRRMLRLQQDDEQGGDGNGANGKGPGGELAPLQVLLARAYRQTGDLDRAQRYYQLAQQEFLSSDPLNAQVLVGQARIALARGGDHVDEARQLFTAAVKKYPDADARLDALIGKGDTQARQGDYPQAEKTFAMAVDQALHRARPDDPRRQTLTDTVRSHIDDAVSRSNYQTALDLLKVLKPMEGKNLPPALLLDFAKVHENLGRQEKAYAAGPGGSEEGGDAGAPAPDAADSVPALADLGGDAGGAALVTPIPMASPGVDHAPTRQARRLANQKAAAHFAKAGDYYLRHAQKMTITDNQAYGNSLWEAAGCYEQAELWDKAIDAYSQFIETRGEDFRRVEARHHLGRGLMARGDNAAALKQFKKLADQQPKSPWTFASLVFMARCYEALGKPGAAERTLLSVVTDHPAIRPGSEEYRQALIALGKLYYRRSEQDPALHIKAIQRLSEAVDRYGESDQGPQLRFLLAEALRRSVHPLDQKLDQRHTQRKRLALIAERNRRLEKAQELYNQVITQLEPRDRDQLSSLNQVYLRNSYFYQGDCAFDRQRYPQAIELYTQAAKRWENQPAALAAMVQIVNAYCEMDQYQQARAANRQALAMLKRIPDKAFDNAGYPMSRRHLEDWLRWNSELNLRGGKPQASRPTAPTPIPTSTQ